MIMQPKTQRWLGVLTLLVIVIIAYIDRINIAILVVNDDFLEHFMIGDGQTSKGLLMTTFLLGYGLSALFLTPILESLFHYRRALSLSVFIWALICAISPLLGSLLALLISRALLGIAEGPLFSLKTIYISDHFEPKNFGKANAITALGISIGLSIGFPLISFLVSQYGWKESFWVLAIINVVGGLSLIHLFIKPNPNSSINLKENRLSIKETFISALKTPRLGWILIIEIATLSYLWGASSWLPSWLISEHNFSMKEMGTLASIPFILSIVSKYAGGWVLDKMKIEYSSSVFAVGGFLTAISIMGLMLSTTIPWIIFFLLSASVCWGFQGPAIPTLIQHHSSKKAVGSTYGVVNGIGNIFSAFVPFIMALVIESKGSVTSGFGVLVISQVMTFFAGSVLLYKMIKTHK